MPPPTPSTHPTPPPPSRTINATCLCTSSSHSITLPTPSWPLPVNACHCTSCRHLTGLLCLDLAHPPKTWTPSPSLVSKLTSYAFSARIRHFFCPTCGTRMLSAFSADGKWDGDGDGEVSGCVWLIPTGTLETADESVVRWMGHIFVGDTKDGGFADLLTRVGGGEGEEERLKRWSENFDSPELPVGWMLPDRVAVKVPKTGERLHGYCHCKRVQVWLSAPSARSKFAKEAYENGGELPSSIDPATATPEVEDTWWLRDNNTRFRAAVCPCNSCRLAANGNSFAHWVYVPTVDVSLSPNQAVPLLPDTLPITITSYRTSPRATYNFCSVCGAVIFWSTDARPYLQDYGVGLFDAPEGARAEGWFRWRNVDLRHRVDGLERAPSVTLAVEEGLREYHRTVQKLLPGHDVDEEDGHR